MVVDDDQSEGPWRPMFPDYNRPGYGDATYGGPSGPPVSPAEQVDRDLPEWIQKRIVAVVRELPHLRRRPARVAQLLELPPGVPLPSPATVRWVLEKEVPERL